MGDLLDASLVICPEIDRNLPTAIPCDQLKMAITGTDSMTVTVKMGTSRHLYDGWKAPIVMASNVGLPYKTNDPKNAEAISRRFAVLEHPHQVPDGERDGLLQERIIKRELPMVILQCAAIYREGARRIRRYALECHDKIKAGMRRVKESISPLIKFMTKSGLVYRDDAYYRLSDLDAKFREWVRTDSPEVQPPSLVSNPEYYKACFGDLGLRVVTEPRKWPIESDALPATGAFVVGVGRPEDYDTAAADVEPVSVDEVVGEAMRSFEALLGQHASRASDRDEFVARFARAARHTLDSYAGGAVRV